MGAGLGLRGQRQPVGLLHPQIETTKALERLDGRKMVTRDEVEGQWIEISEQ